LKHAVFLYSSLFLVLIPSSFLIFIYFIFGIFIAFFCYVDIYMRAVFTFSSVFPLISFSMFFFHLMCFYFLSSRSLLFSFFPFIFSLFFLPPVSSLFQSLFSTLSFTVVFKLNILVSLVFRHSFPFCTILLSLLLIRTFLYPFLFTFSPLTFYFSLLISLTPRI
jgi:hypothetical protein